MKTILMSFFILMTVTAGAKEISINCEEHSAELKIAQKRNQARLQAWRGLSKHLNLSKSEIESKLMGITIDLIREGHEIEAKIVNLEKSCQ